jgi:hypothetical protein
MRKFKNGAIRDTADGKLEYFGVRHPLIEQSFAEYMDRHRNLPDGSKRSSNNWWSGWSTDISLQSMVRHLEDLQALHAGLYAYEVRDKKGVRGVYSFKKLKEGTEITKEECLNAIRFNAGAYLLELLKK